MQEPGRSRAEPSERLGMAHAGAHRVFTQPWGRRAALRGSAHRASPLLRHSSSLNPSSPPPDSQGCLAHTHALHWRISGQSRLPPGVLGDALHQGLPLRSHRETKGHSDRCSPEEKSTSPHLCRKKLRKPSLVRKARAPRKIEWELAGARLGARQARRSKAKARCPRCQCC